MQALLFVMIACMCVCICKSVKYMDIFNPYLLFGLPIFIQYVVYLLYYSENELERLSFICVGAVLITFFCGGLICELRHNPNRIKIYHDKLKVNFSTLYIFYIISTVGFFVSIIEAYQTGNSGKSNFFSNIRINEIYGTGKSFFTKYSVVILFFITLVYMYQYLWDKKNGYTNSILKYRIIGLIIMLITSTLFTLARTELLTYILALSCVYYSFKGGKRTKRLHNLIKKYQKFFYIVFLLIIGFYILGAISGRKVTSEIFSKEFFFYRYTGFTLVTFNTFCIDKPGVKGYIELAWPIKKIIGILGLPMDQTVIVPPGTPYNVVGYVGTVYTAIGLFGLIIFTFILGYLMVLLYINAKKKGGFYLIFYSSYIYTMAISFFAYQFANTFYIYILLLIMIVKIDSNGVLILKRKRDYRYGQ